MFPDLNKYSLPLLILVIQGLVFGFLLLNRFQKNKNASDLFLFLILILTAYFQVCYTLGFMGWYNHFKQTKINYFLLNITSAQGPLIYLYLKSITQSNFKIKPKLFWHFTLFFGFILYRLIIFSYDASQPNFNNVQNGILKVSVDEAYAQTIMGYLETSYMLIYLVFTFQLLINYRKKIVQYFSNTYKLELNWMFSFLVIFSFLFLYSIIQDIISSHFIELGYEKRWWLNLLMALASIFIGVKGYFTDTTKLNNLEFTFNPESEELFEKDKPTKEHTSTFSKAEISVIKELMETKKEYLNPDLNLSDLATKSNLSRGKLSEIINSSFNKNFNDFVNDYRVEAYIEMLQNKKHEKLSLLGIAYECGFNSKATFNRVFKKSTNLSPTEYLNSLKF